MFRHITIEKTYSNFKINPNLMINWAVFNWLLFFLRLLLCYFLIEPCWTSTLVCQLPSVFFLSLLSGLSGNRILQLQENLQPKPSICVKSLVPVRTVALTGTPLIGGLARGRASDWWTSQRSGLVDSVFNSNIFMGKKNQSITLRFN